MLKKALKMSPSVVRNVVRPAKTLLKQAENIMTLFVLRAEVLQEFLSSLWKAKAITAASALLSLKKQRHRLNN